MARDCPSNALFGGEQGMLGIKHSGVVEGKAVDDIMLDTGCSRTMVRGDLVPREKLLEVQLFVVLMGIQCCILWPRFAWRWMGTRSILPLLYLTLYLWQFS